MISPVIEWDHSEDCFVPKFSGDWFEQRNILVNVSDKEFEYIQGHVIDGKLLKASFHWNFDDRIIFQEKFYFRVLAFWFWYGKLFQ